MSTIKENKRQSNFELLRIISMILIVMSHCDDIFGVYKLYTATVGVNKIITELFNWGGQIGVGCFLLISGYFMVEQKITIKKILRVAGEVWSYTIGIWIIWSAYGLYRNTLSMSDCIEEAKYAFLPILKSHYWFVTAYLILMILSPFLNKLIFSLTQTEYRKFLASIIMIFVVLQGGFIGVFPGMSDGRLIPVFIMYFIAGYIRRFRTERKNSAGRHFAVAVFVSLLLFATFYIMTYLGIKNNDSFLIAQRYFYRVLNSPFVVIICVELFIGIIETPFSYNKVINELASCTFGVYLIHGNRLMNEILQRHFPIYKEERSLYILIYSLLGFFVIYIGCTIVAYVRNKTIGKVWNKLLDKSFLENH